MLHSILRVVPALQGGTPSGEGAPPPGLLSSPWFPIVMIGAIMWFVVIGPERKVRRQREAMLAELKKGARVMTSSGIFGTVVEVRETVIVLQVADGVRMKMARSSVQTIVEDEDAQGKDTGKDG